MPNPIVDELENMMPAESVSKNGQIQSKLIMPAIGALLIPTSDALPKWWTPARDRVLERVLLESEHLAGLAYTALTKLVTVPLSFVPKDTSIVSHVEYAEKFTDRTFFMSGMGETLPVTLKKYIGDWMFFDNGGFMEIVGGEDDNDPSGPLLGPPAYLKHLDSRLCTRTGYPKYPVTTIDPEDGGKYALHWSRVIYSSQMPSGRASMNGVGLSCVSRSVNLSKVLASQITYKMEKMGTRPAAKLIFGKGIDAQSMIAAFATAQVMMDNMGLQNFGLNVFIGADENADINATDLHNFDPFNEEEGTLMAMYALAFIWGMKVQDIWPVTGSRASDEIANMQSRGRLSADFFQDLTTQLNFKYCPPFLKAKFDAQDDQEDHQRAVIEDIQTRSNERLAKSDIIDEQGQRRIMVSQGRMSRDEFVRQQLADGFLEDGTPIAVLFYTEDKVFSELLTINGPDPLLFEENDPDEMLVAIHERMAECYRFMANNRSTAQNKKAKEALAALQWLERQYTDQQYEKRQESQTPEDEPADQEEQDGDAGPDQQPEPEPEQTEPESQPVPIPG